MNAARIREGGSEDFLPVMRTVEGALLEVDAEAIRSRLAEGSVLVAESDGRVVGALVFDRERAQRVSNARSAHVEAIAVRRSRRRRGIGAALVRAAIDRVDRLTADFDPRVRGFYEALGFEIEEREDRLWGVLA
ncbi:MAG: GNAT family N-acetyltransferase [Salinigranum sp.]